MEIEYKRRKLRSLKIRYIEFEAFSPTLEKGDNDWKVILKKYEKIIARLEKEIENEQ